MMKWLIIGGTTESLEAVSYLLKKKVCLTVSVATDMGAALYKDHPVHMWTGRLDKDGFVDRMAAEGISHVLDTSHPYALEVTRIVKTACQELGIPYFRYTRIDVLKERKKSMPPIYRVKDARESAVLANRLGGRVVLTTGIKTLDIYRDYVEDFQERCFARVLANKDSLERCEKIFRHASHWRAENPPFSVEDNRRFLAETKAELLITKDSGAAGGVPEKLKAAKLEGAAVILIDRPEESDVLEDFEQLDKYFR